MFFLSPATFYSSPLVIVYEASSDIINYNHHPSLSITQSCSDFKLHLFLGRPTCLFPTALKPIRYCVIYMERKIFHSIYLIISTLLIVSNCIVVAKVSSYYCICLFHGALKKLISADCIRLL